MDVTFSATGANSAAQAADKYAASTAKAGASAQKAQMAVKTHTMLLKAQAEQARLDAQELDKLGNAQERSAKGQFNLRNALRLGGFGKEGRVVGAFQNGGSATVAAGLTFMAAHIAIKAFANAMDRSVDAIKVEVEGRHTLANAIKDAKDQIGKTAQATAAELGPVTRDIVGRFGTEGIDTAKRLSLQSGMEPKDVMQAMLEGNSMHRGDVERWMGPVLDAARLNGTTATSEMKNTAAMSDASADNRQEVATSLVGIHRRRVMDSDWDVNPAGERIKRDGTTIAIEQNDRLQAQKKWDEFDRIPAAAAATRGDIGAAKDPVQSAIKALHDKAQEQLTVLIEIRRAMSPADRAIDNIRYRTRLLGTDSVLEQISKAQAAMNAVSGLP